MRQRKIGNSAPDGLRSRVQLPATWGTCYLVVVDGVNRAQGAISINWRLGTLVPSSGAPTPQVVAAGSSITLTAAVGSAYPPPTCQWFWNGVSILGATQSNLRLTNLQPSQAGLYSVRVSNFMNSVLQTNTLLSVEFFRLRGPVRATGGGLEFWVEGPPGASFTLQSTTNLPAPNGTGPWTSMLTNRILTAQEPFR